MFDFLTKKNRKRVQAVLANRLNQRSMAELNGVSRNVNRTAFCKVMFAVPKVGKYWATHLAVPVVGHDISTDGLAVIHTQRFDCDLVLIGLPGENSDLKFLQCEVRHTTDLGYGFYKIGVFAQELAEMTQRDADAIQDFADEWQRNSSSNVTVA